MKAVIFAGGLGTRISEETSLRPKPMVEIGGRPILWHIMKMYAHHGITDFVLCLGYKGSMIKEYFTNYFLYSSDITIDLRTNQTTVHAQNAEPWRVTMVDTGESTMTGGRLKRVEPFVSGETFCCTYGDGVSDVNIAALVAFHRLSGKAATLTAVQPPGRFGALALKGQSVLGFEEKPRGDGAWVNGGFFVLEPSIFDTLVDDNTVWEREPLQQLAISDRLAAYQHQGFWHAMDTLRDKTDLETLWHSGRAPWKFWT